MFCPQGLRGRYYPTETVAGCKDYYECPVCFRCQAYQPTRWKCSQCEPWEPRSAETPRHCSHRTERAVLADAKLLIEHYRSPLYHPQRPLQPGAIQNPAESARAKLARKQFEQVWSRLEIMRPSRP